MAYSNSRELVQQIHRTVFPGMRSLPPPRFPRFLPPSIKPRIKPAKFNNDWQFTIKHSVSANMFPAKYGFLDLTTASCSDYVVYATDITGAGEANPANIVGLTNLYSGPTNSSCPTGTPGTNATLLFAYHIGQPNKTSTVLSMDGTKIAWVEDSNPPIFHVLKYGTTGNNGSADLNTATIISAPDIGISNNASLASVTLTGSTADTLSSPFVDYDQDIAYVGTDDGMLYAIRGVFNGTPTLSNSVTITAGSALTGPVLDPGPTNNINRIFVGSATGDLYSVSTDFSTLQSVTVGDGSAFGGLVDPPVVDVTGGTNGFVYEFTGSSDNTAAGTCGTGNATVVQIPADPANFAQANVRVACVGAGGNVNIHPIAFNDAYFSSATSTNWFMFACGLNAAGTNTDLYRIGFNASRQMNTGTPTAANRLRLSRRAEECSPLTEFKNPNLAGAQDQLFLTIETTENVESFNLDGSGTGVNALTGMPNAALNTFNVVSGTSGIIIDNIALNGQQGSNIYFTSLSFAGNCNGHGNLHCAYKLSQSGLN